MKAAIKEIFESVQGEGLLVGYKQVFIRFCDCNLRCDFCDTDYSRKNSFVLSEEELFDKIKKFNSNSISLTGGEPLMQADFLQSFLKKYKPFLNKEVFLETNGTLFHEVDKVIDFVEVVGMDIKIKSATGEDPDFEANEMFLKACSNKAFIKTVFTKNIKDYEIETVASIAKEYDAPLVIQPKTPIDKDLPYLEIFNKFYSIYDNVRLIPQTHTFLGLQ